MILLCMRAAVRDHVFGNTAYGFGIRVENIRQARFTYFFLLFSSVFLSFSLLLSEMNDLFQWTLHFEVILLMVHLFFLIDFSYERADPNFVMLTPTKEHLAQGIAWEAGKRPMLESNINAGNFDGVPMELRPLRKIL